VYTKTATALVKLSHKWTVKYSHQAR